MSEMLDNTILKPLTLSAEDSPAKTFPYPTQRDTDSTEQDQDYGLNIYESFASCDPDTFSLKTSQTLLHGGYQEFSATLPQAGMMRNGRLYERPTLSCPITVNGFSLLPTPGASDHRFGVAKFTAEQILKSVAKGGQIRLSYLLTCSGVPISLFPKVYAWIMGFPLNFLKLKQQSKDMETQYAHPSQNGLENE